MVVLKLRQHICFVLPLVVIMLLSITTAAYAHVNSNGCNTTTAANQAPEQQQAVAQEKKAPAKPKAATPVKSRPTVIDAADKSTFSFRDMMGSEESEEDSDTFHGADPLTNAVKAIVATLLSTII